MIPSGIDLSDARWFPIDLHVPERRYGFLYVDDAVLERSSFLDTRIEAALDRAVALSADAIGRIDNHGSPGWLFHTSFCGSTLLGRVLHAPPHAVCLREPMLLRRLADSRHAGCDVGPLVGQSVALLSRPWHREGTVLVKPTHAALNIAGDLLSSTPHSRAIVLTSGLEDFLISNLKKTPESQAKVPQLVERAMQATGFHARLPSVAFQPPDLLCATVLQWAAQRELVADIVGATGDSRVRAIDMEQLLDDLHGTATDVAAWLMLGIPDDTVDERCRMEGGRNAKATVSPYGTVQRMEEMRLVQRTFAEPLSRARAWADKNVLPFMRSQARELTGQSTP